MSDDFVSSKPDPSYVAIAAGILRGLLQLASGFGFAWALAVTGSQITMLATGIVMVIAFVWSAWQKVGQAWAVHQAAVMSASKRTAVQPTEKIIPPTI